MELEQRGVATVTIVTSAFIKAAEAHRKLLKRPELAYFVVPHPIVSMSDGELRASADAIFEDVLKAMSRAAESAEG